MLRLRSFAIVIAAALTTVAGQPSAAAQQQQTPAGSIQLLSQTAWVNPGSDFVLRLGVDTPMTADLELSVSVYQAVQNRTQFQSTVAGRVSGSPIQATSAPLADLERDAGGAVRVVLPVQSPAEAAERSRLRLRSPGVFPVRVELRQLGGGRVLDRLTTHLVYVPPAIEGPRLGVSLVVPLHAAPSRTPAGRVAVNRATATALGTVGRVIAETGGADITLLPTPETMEAIVAEAGDPSVVERLREAATGRSVIGGPYVPVDPAELTGPLAAEAVAQQNLGNETLRRALGTEPASRIAVFDGRVNDQAIAGLRDVQVDQVVVPENALTSIPLVVTLAQPFQLRGRQGRLVPAAAADAGLAAHAASGSRAVLGAHHLLADLAVIYFDSPGRVRGVVAALPRTWRPDARFAEALLSGVNSSPVLQPMNLDRLFTSVPPLTGRRREPLVRDVAATTAAAAGDLPAGRIRDARARLAAFASIPQPGAPILEELERRLLVAQARDLGAKERQAHLDGLDRRIDTQLASIHIPRSRSVTLTAREGEIPVTVRNDLGHPARVVLDLSSDQLEFPNGDRIELDLDRRNTTLRVRVRARTSGSFPLLVNVTSPEGDLAVAESRFTVRSTAASGVGVVLSAGAIIFLLAWWLRHLVQARRRVAAHG